MALQLSGLLQVQFVVKNNQLKVIECSVSIPKNVAFVSKSIGRDIVSQYVSMIIANATYPRMHSLEIPYVSVRVPQFSTDCILNADPHTGVHMSSTGEVSCFGNTCNEALLLAEQSAHFLSPEKNVLLSIGGLEYKVELFSTIKQLHMMGFSLYATKHTHDFLLSRSIESVLLCKPSEPRSPNVREYLERKRIHMAIIIPSHSEVKQKTDGYFMRRLAIDYHIPLFTNPQRIKRFTEALESIKIESIPLQTSAHFWSTNVNDYKL